MNKTCTKCGKEKSLKEFAKNVHGRFGNQAICKSCDSKRAKIYLSRPENLQRRHASCAKWYRLNKNSVRARKRSDYVKRRAVHLAWEAKRRAARKGVPYLLTAEDVNQLQTVIDAGACQITGTPFDFEMDRAWNSPSLDRIKPGNGYAPGNVRVVCRAMNFAMGEWGEDPVWEMFMNWSRRRKHLSKAISK